MNSVGSKKENKSTLKGAFVILIASALFGTLGTVTGLAYQNGMAPASFAAWRETVGTIMMLILLALGIGRPAKEDRIPFSKLPGSEIRNVCIAAVAFMTFSLAIFYAFGLVTVALALLIFYTYPAFVTIIGGITGKETITASKIGALIMALGGGVLVVVGQLIGSSVQVSVLGIILAIVAALADTVYFTVGRDGYPSIPPTYATIFFLFAGAITFGIIALFTGGIESLIVPFQKPSLIPILAFAGVFGAAIPTIMILAGIRMIGASRASILALFEPVVGVVLASIVLGQKMFLIQIIGGVLVLGAAVVLQLAPEPKAIEKSTQPKSPKV